MSHYGWEFYSNASSLLSVNSEQVDIGLEECPYIVLSGQAGLPRMKATVARQRQNGATVDVLVSPEFETIPWLKTDGLGAAIVGQGGEGWVDPRLTLHAMRHKEESLGVTYLTNGVADVILSESSGLVHSVVLDSGETISARTFVNAAGAWSAEVSAMAGIVLPVESRKRSVFVFKTQNPPRGFTTLVDPTFAKHGLYARAYHGDFFAMTAPAPKDDLHTRDSSIDFALFDEFVRPALANRVVGFEDIELVDSWAGHYEVSTFDQNAFVGRHAKIRNFVFAAGFTGHGVMHAPATGRGVAELLISGKYQTLDLTPFRFERIAENDSLDDAQPSEHRSTDAGL